MNLQQQLSGFEHLAGAFSKNASEMMDWYFNEDGASVSDTDRKFLSAQRKKTYDALHWGEKTLELTLEGLAIFASSSLSKEAEKHLEKLLKTSVAAEETQSTYAAMLEEVYASVRNSRRFSDLDKNYLAEMIFDIRSATLEICRIVDQIRLALQVYLSNHHGGKRSKAFTKASDLIANLNA